MKYIPSAYPPPLELAADKAAKCFALAACTSGVSTGTPLGPITGT